jgi:uncharacterized protein (TIGR02466 family)
MRALDGFPATRWPDDGRKGAGAVLKKGRRLKMTIHLTNKEMFMLFPTALFTGKLTDLTACDRVEKKLRELQKSSNRPKTDAYMTPDNIQTLPELQEVSELIMGEAGQILDAYKIKRDSHYITNMWANIANPNRRHHMHIHPNCLFSGILYIKTPKNCGPTMFASPRQLARMIEPTFTEKNEINSDVFVFPAEKGRMLMWPSYLPHAVEHGTADETEDRIVLAFNIMIRGRIDQHTMSLELT